MTRDLVEHFPHEMCILHRWIIIVFSVPTCTLVGHNAWIIPRLVDDGLWGCVLATWSLLRILFGAARPYLWWHSTRLYIEARFQPSHELVAEAFMRAQKSRVITLNNKLGTWYLAWMAISTAYLLLKAYVIPGKGLTNGESLLWYHCKWNMVSLVAQVRAPPACGHQGRPPSSCAGALAVMFPLAEALLHLHLLLPHQYG